MKVVLDTNVLLQITSPYLRASIVWDKLLTGDYVLCYSNEILLEYEEILQKAYGKDVAEVVIGTMLLLPNAQRIDIYYNLNLIQGDPDDNKFADCAFAAGAKYIVTEDKHFNTLKRVEFPKIDILKLKDFKELLTKKRKK